MKVRVDVQACTGHGRCYDLAPAVFEDDEAGHCVLRLAEVPPEHRAAARSAADNCPERAIEVED